MKTSVIGFPRIGSLRELKFASEKYFSGSISDKELEATAAGLRRENLLLQKEDFQLSVVDIIAHDEKQKKAYLDEYKNYKKAKQQLEDLKAEIAKNRENEEFMRFQFKELDDANLQEGELEQLEQEAETLSHSEDIKTALYEADNALSGEDGSILDKLKNAAQQIDNIKEVYPDMKEVAERMQSSYIELKDIAQEISGSVDNIEFDPNRLETIKNRRNRTIQNNVRGII